MFVPVTFGLRTASSTRHQHLSEGWQFGGLLKSHFIINVPAQMRSENESWYRGTADAIYQNINLIEQSDPHLVAIFGADHIYRMNVAGMIDFHPGCGLIVDIDGGSHTRVHRYCGLSQPRTRGHHRSTFRQYSS